MDTQNSKVYNFIHMTRWDYKIRKTWINDRIFFGLISWKSQILGPIYNFYEKTVKIKSLLKKTLMSRAKISLHLPKFCNFIPKIAISSKFAPNFGFFLKFIKKINIYLFMFYWTFGLILPYEWNCIPLNFVYPKGHPLSFIKNYFY